MNPEDYHEKVNIQIVSTEKADHEKFNSLGDLKDERNNKTITDTMDKRKNDSI